MTEAGFVTLVRDYGLWIIAPIAVVEGPVVSVLAGYGARLGYLPLGRVYGCLVLADLAGDLVIYGLGRLMRGRALAPWMGRIGLTRRRVARVLRVLRTRGGGYLVAAKLTHSAGFAVLFAAGMARMPLLAFVGFNLAATLPKVAGFVALGWVFGEVSGPVGTWLWSLGLALALAVGVALVAVALRRRGNER